MRGWSEKRATTWTQIIVARLETDGSEAETIQISGAPWVKRGMGSESAGSRRSLQWQAHLFSCSWGQELEGGSTVMGVLSWWAWLCVARQAHKQAGHKWASKDNISLFQHRTANLTTRRG